MFRDAAGFKHIYICTGYTDLRGGIDRLAGIVKGKFGMEPTAAGSIFLFCGRRRDRIKALCHEGDGWLLCYKRLSGENGFQWPRSESEVRELTPQQFRWLMEGLAIDQKKVITDKRPKYY